MQIPTRQRVVIHRPFAIVHRPNGSHYRFFGYCFALGNIFSGLPPSQQSIPAFNAASMAWWYGVFSAHAGGV